MQQNAEEVNVQDGSYGRQSNQGNPANQPGKSQLLFGVHISKVGRGIFQRIPEIR